MAPKPLQQLGEVQPNGNGWRAWIKISGQLLTGPQQVLRSAAETDLETIRGAKSRDDVPRVIAMLKAATIEAKRAQMCKEDERPCDDATPSASNGGATLAASPSSCSKRRRLSTPPAKRPQSSGLAPADKTRAAIEPRTAPDQDSLADKADRPPSAPEPRTLTLRGLCIQYPFSQLLLAAIKGSRCGSSRCRQPKARSKSVFQARRCF